MTISDETRQKVAEAIANKFNFDFYAAADNALKAAIESGEVVKPSQELIDLNDIKVGSIIEYRNGWLATVFDITDVVWLGGAGKAKANARIWSRAEGREWYHTHRRDGYSTTDRSCDILKILPTPPKQVENSNNSSTNSICATNEQEKE